MVFVIGSIGVCIADMPQALDLAGCQHQSSGHGDGNFDFSSVQTATATPKISKQEKLFAGVFTYFVSDACC